VDRNIVLRPHPREDIEQYRKRFSDNTDVYVVKKGGVRPWIFSADAVVHNNSTTGIESALLDTLVFSYRPIKYPKYDNDLPIRISKEINTYSELYQSLSGNLDSKSVSISTEDEDALKDKIHNISNPNAAKNIADNISSINVQKQTKISGVEPSLEQKGKRFLLKMFSDEFVETIGETIFRTDREGTRNKFPGLSVEELEAEIDLFENVYEDSLPEMRITTIDDLANTFIIESA
jgi:hypothetical protein